MMASTLDDFAADELAGLFKSFVPHQRIGLAISGGPDSVALLLLARCWQSLQPPPQPFLQVLTVDHRLRPASADEAGAVVALAGRLGLAAEILPWNGEKPLSGIQAAARAARYRLLAGAARCLELAAIATAHTRDDQAETLLMRLSRGSGIDGLAAMAAVGSIDGLIVLRPLLDVDKSRLVAALDAAVVPYARDPSNDDTAFERVRWRQAWPTLSALGISSDRLALSARRIGRARLALDQWTDRAVGKLGALWPEGWAQLGTDDLLELPEEIIIRVLQRLIGAVGGDPEGPGLSQLETIAGQLREVGGGGAAYTRTLARCIIRVRRYHLDILREVGRETLPAIDWDGGSRLLWDHRFELAPRPAGQFLVRAMTAGELAEQVVMTNWPANFPPEVALALPTLWQGGELRAVTAPMMPLQPAVERLKIGDEVMFRMPRGLLDAASQPDFGQNKP